MLNLPAFARALDAEEDARAQVLHDDLIAGLSPSGSRADRPAFERTRILNEQGGLNWADPVHLRALGIASGEDEAYLVNPRHDTLPRMAVDLPAMTAFIGSNDTVDVDVFDGLTAEWDADVLELLAPAFVEQWTLVSTTGRWIFSAWNAGDLSVLGGTADVVDAYSAARPEATSEVIEWLIQQGETAATDDPELAAIAKLRRKIAHPDFDFFASELHEYLMRFYSDDDLEFLWSTTERIFRSDTRRGLTADERGFPTHAGPPVPRVPGTEVYEFLDSTMTTSGSPDERLVRMMSRDRDIRSRLDAIWSATS
ncbi:MAG: hypothetical protein JHC98_11310 [Thermoleophilaceae bacterium]|nr:hypothetical protein [Thermoleophilaceae bacterium]